MVEQGTDSNVHNDQKKHTIRYSDLGRQAYMHLSGELEIILTHKQADLLNRFNAALIDSTPGFRSKAIYLYHNLRLVVKYPRLIFLSQYYDPENLDLAGFEAVDERHVRLTFYV